MSKTLFILSSMTSALCSGGLFFTSFMHTPAYIVNPSDEILLKQWQKMGATGKAMVPPLAIFVGGCGFANAYISSNNSQRYRFVAAGLLSLAILPYTVLSLASTNSELAAREGKRGGSRHTELQRLPLKELLKRWSSRSAVRSVLLLASSLVSCDAMLQLTWRD